MDSEYASSIVDGITYGCIATKIHATAAAIPTELSRKDQPSRRIRVVRTTATRHTAAITRGSHPIALRAYTSCPQSANTAVTPALSTESLAARSPARSRRSPSVLSAMNTAPDVRNSVAVTTPPSRVNGVRSEKNPPVSWWDASPSAPATASGATTTPSRPTTSISMPWTCLLYTSDAADDLLCVDLGGRRIIKKKKKKKNK